jgi:tol-pal system protein YbgF
MKNSSLLPIAVAVGLTLSGCASAERAQVVEYNPNAPVAQPQAATPEVGMLGYVNEKFNRMERQLEDSADRMDHLANDVDRLKALEKRVAELEKKLAMMSATSANTSVDTSKDTGTNKVALTTAADTDASQAAYKKAFDQLMAGKYAEAGKLFKDYLDKYPDTDQTSNAYYWLGETQFVGRKFDLALKSFAQTVKLEGPKASDALQKQGECYLELDKDKEAKAAFIEVKKRFPDSTAAKQADKSLAALKK